MLTFGLTCAGEASGVGEAVGDSEGAAEVGAAVAGEAEVVVGGGVSLSAEQAAVGKTRPTASSKAGPARTQSGQLGNFVMQIVISPPGVML